MVNLMPAIVALNATVDISTITSAITSIVTAAIQWTTSWATEIVSTPLLLFFVPFYVCFKILTMNDAENSAKAKTNSTKHNKEKE